MRDVTVNCNTIHELNEWIEDQKENTPLHLLEIHIDFSRMEIQLYGIETGIVFSKRTTAYFL